MKMLVYFMVIWNILRTFGNTVAIWYIYPRFGTLCQEKSGNPARNEKKHYFSRTCCRVDSGQICRETEPSLILETKVCSGTGEPVQ
jgi:hypothetical protein